MQLPVFTTLCILIQHFLKFPESNFNANYDSIRSVNHELICLTVTICETFIYFMNQTKRGLRSQKYYLIIGMVCLRKFWAQQRVSKSKCEIAYSCKIRQFTLSFVKEILDNSPNNPIASSN